MNNIRLQRIFNDMKRRCCNPKCPDYKDYGGRGITVCSEWYIPHSWKGFLVFKEWALANGYSDDLTVDRIDVNKGYSPDNCRWATAKEQANNKRNNRLIIYKGKTKNISQWSRELGIHKDTLRYRLDHNWSVERAFEEK